MTQNEWMPRRCSEDYLQWREDEHMAVPTVPMKIAEETVKTVAVVLTTSWACYLAWVLVQIVRSIKA